MSTVSIPISSFSICKNRWIWHRLNLVLIRLNLINLHAQFTLMILVFSANDVGAKHHLFTVRILFGEEVFRSRMKTQWFADFSDHTSSQRSNWSRGKQFSLRNANSHVSLSRTLFFSRLETIFSVRTLRV